MITKNHPSAYAELFAKANQILKKHNNKLVTDYSNINISNIDEYFACLRDLATLEDMSLNPSNSMEYIDPIFTILPATEQTFYIDADKRTINIPDNFARYGVGVQGDEIAEILYFSIDRYFDAMDLADMDIIIQWKHEKDEEHVANLSATYKKSLTLQPGKIVFGWPITAEVTERSGNIKFSVRFYRRDDNDDTLQYSFSTLTATIKIQTGLDFELNSGTTNLSINKNRKIYDNLRNSKNVNVGYIIASPVFTNYFVKENDVDEWESASAAMTYDLPITFIAKAEIPSDTPDEHQISGGGLSYAWHNKNNSNVALESNIIYKKVDTAQSTYNPKEIYYHINDDGDYEPYYVNGDNNPFDDEVELYVRYASFEPAAAGTYYAVANNVYAPGALQSVLSKEWIVPGPSAPSFTYADEDKKVILVDGKANVAIAVSVDGNVEASWYHNTIPNHETAIKSNTVTLDSDNSASQEVTEEGYYFLWVKNTRNNASLETFSSPVWVRHEASVPSIKAYYVNGTEKQDSSIVAYSGDELSIELNAITYGDISYQWRKNEVDIPNATDSIYEVTSEDIGSAITCFVTNSYKETDNTVTSNQFHIVAQ